MYISSRVLRDNGRELHRRILLTPYSREEYALAFSQDPIENELERARRFFIRTQMSRNGQSMESARTNSNPNFSYNIRETRKQTAIAVTRYRNRAERLRRTIDGLLNIQIENLPAVKLIENTEARMRLAQLRTRSPQKTNRNVQGDIR